MYSKGKIGTGMTEYVAMCATCDNEDTTHHKALKRALVDFKKWGWRKRKSGWVCPRCARKTRVEKGDTT